MSDPSEEERGSNKSSIFTMFVGQSGWISSGESSSIECGNDLSPKTEKVKETYDLKCQATNSIVEVHASLSESGVDRYSHHNQEKENEEGNGLHSFGKHQMFEKNAGIKKKSLESDSHSRRSTLAIDNCSNASTEHRSASRHSKLHEDRSKFDKAACFEYSPVLLLEREASSNRRYPGHYQDHKAKSTQSIAISGDVKIGDENYSDIWRNECVEPIGKELLTKCRRSVGGNFERRKVKELGISSQRRNADLIDYYDNYNNQDQDIARCVLTKTYDECSPIARHFKGKKVCDMDNDKYESDPCRVNKKRSKECRDFDQFLGSVVSNSADRPPNSENSHSLLNYQGSEILKSFPEELHQVSFSDPCYDPSGGEDVPEPSYKISRKDLNNESMTPSGRRTRTSFITSVLDELQEDIQEVPPKFDVTSTWGKDTAPTAPKSRSERVFVQGQRGFTLQPIPSRVDLCGLTRRNEPAVLQQQKWCTQPVILAINLQKKLRKLYNVCHGLLGGFGFAHTVLVLTLVVDHDDADFMLGIFSYVTTLLGTWYYLLGVLCLLSALDRADFAHVHRLDFVVGQCYRLQDTTLIGLYFFVIFLTGLCAYWEDKLTSTFMDKPLSDTKIMFEEFSSWRMASILRGIAALLGWMIMSLSSETEMLSAHLDKMVKFKEKKNRRSKRKKSFTTMS